MCRNFFALIVILASFAGWANVVPGTWGDDYALAKEYADTRHVPLVYYWGMSGCGECLKCKNAFETQVFKEWMPQRGYVFVRKTAPSGSSAPSVFRGLTKTPFFLVSWIKRDGTAVELKFSGRSGDIPGTSESQKLKNDALAKALIAAIDGAVGSYVPFVYEPSSFETDAAHPYEVETGLTTNVTIVINRPAAMSDEVSTNLFVLGSVTNEIAWAVGEKRREVSLDELGGHVIGDRIGLQLMDPARPEDGVQCESAIVFVAPQGNSVANPRAPGESFAFGEWTLDYEAARTAVRSTPGAKMLVFFSGVLWCPYCKGMETSLLAAAEFPEWARDNKVALVLMDQGRATSPATAAGQNAPRLVTYGLDPNGSGASGASYASRHMVTPATAEAYMSLVTRLTVNCLAPESTAVRCGNPTMILLDPKTETPIARLNAIRDDDKVYDPVENLARLDDLVKLTDHNESNACPSTTALALSVTDVIEGVSLQINDAKRVFRVNGIRPRTFVTFAAAPVPARDVTLTLYRTTSTDAEAEVLATGVNTVTCRFLKVLDNVFLKVSAFGEKKSYGVNTTFDFSLKGTEEIDPEPPDTEFDIYTGFAVDRIVGVEGIENLSSVKVKVVSGKLPKGLKLAYDRKAKAVRVSGSPKETVESSVVFSVTGKRSDGSMFSCETTLDFSITAPTSVNPFTDKAQALTLPVYADNRLAGLLEVKTTTRNKLTAKYTGVGKKKLSFSGVWQDIDFDDSAVAVMTLKGGETLRLGLGADGSWGAAISGLEEGEVSSEGVRALEPGELPRYVGSYTVTLPGEGWGTGYLTFTVKNQNKVSVSGMLANGTTVNAKGVLLSGGADKALLPVFVRTSKDVLAVELLISADGRERQVYEPMTVVGTGRQAVWAHNVKGEEFTLPLDVCGAWYDATANLESYCFTAYELEETPVVMKAGLDFTGFVPGVQGQPSVLAPLDVTVEAAKLTVNDPKNWLKLKLVKKTGLVSGTVALQFPATGRKVKAKFKGVVLPGWYDCRCGEGIPDRPFVSAAVYYKDKVNGKSVSIGCGLDLWAKTQLD